MGWGGGRHASASAGSDHYTQDQSRGHRACETGAALTPTATQRVGSTPMVEDEKPEEKKVPLLCVSHLHCGSRTNTVCSCRSSPSLGTESTSVMITMNNSVMPPLRQKQEPVPPF
jgi:hypothetical protein